MMANALRRLQCGLFTFLSYGIFTLYFNAFHRALLALSVFHAN